MTQRVVAATFWDDPHIAKLTPLARLLFLCFITDPSLTDDYGVLPASPQILRKHAFGMDDDISTSEVKAMRDMIVETCPNVVLFEARNQEWLYLVNFDRYQCLRYKRKSSYPSPPIPGRAMGGAEPASETEELELGEEELEPFGERADSGPSEMEAEGIVENSGNVPKNSGTFPKNSGNVAQNFGTSRVVLSSNSVELNSVAVAVAPDCRKNSRDGPPDGNSNNAQSDGDIAELFRLVHEAGILPSQTMAEQYVAILEDDARGDIALVRECFREAAEVGARPHPKWLRAVVWRCRREGLLPGQWRKSGANNRKCDLNDPDTLREAIRREEARTGRKRNEGASMVE